MITAVNTILSAMAFSDLIVNISNIPYLMHELSDSTNFTSFYSFQWALYILFHAHTTVTAHTISIWLTCLLATWRYFVVCRSQSSNQRNFSVGLAKRTIVGVFLLVPIFCIPNYLSFAIVSEETETNQTIYKVGFSHLADQSQFIKTFHFWIYSCLTKLIPCVLLTFFTTVLIRKLLSARERRLRLASYGQGALKDLGNDSCTGSQRALNEGGGANSVGGARVNASHRKSGSELVIINKASVSEPTEGGEEGGGNLLFQPLNMAVRGGGTGGGGGGSMMATTKATTTTSANELNQAEPMGGLNSNSEGSKSKDKLQLNSGSSLGGGCATEAEVIATSSSDNGRQSSNSSNSSMEPNTNNNQHQHRQQLHRPRSGLMVDCIGANHQTVSTSTIPTSRLMAEGYLEPNTSTITSAACDSESKTMDNNRSNNKATVRLGGGRASLALGTSTGCLVSNNGAVVCIQEKRTSGPGFSTSRGRSVGSTTLAPLQIVKIQASQRQISQNETTTRLLIAVMIVFLICEFPAGILAALCAVLGQDFFENVYQPTGTLTDLLALINSSVNFVLYCFMSTQFRITFYRVVLHCPAPHGVSEK